MRETRLVGILLLLGAAFELAALGFPLLDTLPAFGTDDAALTFQLPIGLVLIAAGVRTWRGADPVDLGVATGLGALLLGRAATLLFSLPDVDLGADLGLVLVVAGSVVAAGAGRLAWDRRPAAGGGRLRYLAAAAALLGVLSQAFEPDRGFEFFLADRSWADIGTAPEIVLAVAIPVLAMQRGTFGSGMALGAAAFFATRFASAVVAGAGLGFGSWCALGAGLALICLGVALTEEADELEDASGPGTLAR